MGHLATRWCAEPLLSVVVKYSITKHHDHREGSWWVETEGDGMSWRAMEGCAERGTSGGML